MSESAEINRVGPTQKMNGEEGFVVDAARPDKLLPTLRTGLSEAGKWWRIARLEVRRRFYQTGLGPWWMVIGNGAFVLALSFLYSGVVKIPQESFFPYLLTGFLVWIFISDSFTAGANVFVEEYGFISQMRINYLGLVLKNLFRRTLVFLPNLVLLAPLPFLIHPQPLAILTIIPALLLIVINSFMQTYWFSMISAVFRDFPLIIGTAMRFLFFLTPIMWDADRVTDPLRRAIAHFNPLFHIIETVRAPVMGGGVPMHSWMVLAGVTVVNALFFILAFRRANARIVYLAA